MTGNLNSEEAAALADAAGAPHPRAHVSVVPPRDFTEPRTLSADRIARMRKTLAARLQVIANSLAGPLRGHPTLTLGDVAEVNAQGLFDGYVRPFLVFGFMCNGNLGWVIWEAGAARIACDTILSGPPTETELEEAATTREPILTRTERRVVGNLLDELVQRITAEFELVAEAGVVWQEPEEMTTMEDLGPDADARRIFVHLGVDGAAGGACKPIGMDAPMEVPVRVTVRIGRANLELGDLVKLGPGSLVPLDREAHEPADVLVNGKVITRGEVVTIDNTYGVRITSVENDGV